MDEELRLDIQRQTFLGRFTLNPNDNQDHEQPLDFVTVIHYNKYPGFLFDQIHKHFIRYVGTTKINSLWLSHNGQPVHWHLPFYQIQFEEEITFEVNYKQRPESVIPIYESLTTELENRYFWTLKQSIMIRNKTKWQYHLNYQSFGLTLQEYHNLFAAYQDEVNEGFYKLFHKIWEPKLKEIIPLRIIYKGSMLQIPHTVRNLEETISGVIRTYLNIDEAEFTVNGLKVAEDLPIRTLITYLYAPDGFSYIVIFDLQQKSN